MKIRGKWLAAAVLMLVAFVLALVACSDGDDAPGPTSGNPVGSGAKSTQTIGAAGGTFSLGFVELDIPAGAVPAGTSITVTESTTPVPSTYYTAVTPLYLFAPDGLVFAKPATVTFRGATGGGARIFWSKQSDVTSYEPLTTNASGNAATAQITHFSGGFLGFGPDGGAPGRDSGSPALLAPATFAPAAGTFVGSVDVTLATTAPGATIYYTLDGTEPAVGSSVYVAPIALEATTVVKAVVRAGEATSAVTSAEYTITSAPAVVAPVTFNPPSGNFNTNISVALSTETAGATIHYTVDGSAPTRTSEVYVPGIPIAVSASTTIKAFAVKDGLSDSEVTAASYTLESVMTEVQPVSFDPASGSFTDSVSVTLTTPTLGATIYYTLDGSAPTTASTKYTDPLVITTTSTLRAFATKTGAANSAVTTATYTIALSTAPVTFSPGEGTYTTFVDLSMSTTTQGADIFFTVDGTTPSTSSSVFQGPITIVHTTTVRALAKAPGRTISAMTQAIITIDIPKGDVESVAFDPLGGTFINPVSVGLSTVTSGATIFYTLDGSTPSALGGTTAQYSAGSPVPVDAPAGGGPVILKAYATKAGDNDSSVTSATYAFKTANVTFSPDPGAIAMPANVALRTDTSPTAVKNVVIHYTVDGSKPTTSSPFINGQEGVVHLTEGATIRAFAVRPDYVDADETSAVYTAAP